MQCVNCDYSWCWICGLPSDKYSTYSFLFHIFCELLTLLGKKYKIKKRKGLLIIVGFYIFTPVIAPLWLICFYFYWLFDSYAQICINTPCLANNLGYWIVFCILSFPIVVPLSLIALVFVAIIGALCLALAYVPITIMLIIIFFNWCLKAKKGTAISSNFKNKNP